MASKAIVPEHAMVQGVLPDAEYPEYELRFQRPSLDCKNLTGEKLMTMTLTPFEVYFEIFKDTNQRRDEYYLSHAYKACTENNWEHGIDLNMVIFKETALATLFLSGLIYALIPPTMKGSWPYVFHSKQKIDDLSRKSFEQTLRFTVGPEKAVQPLPYYFPTNLRVSNQDEKVWVIRLYGTTLRFLQDFEFHRPLSRTMTHIKRIYIPRNGNIETFKYRNLKEEAGLGEFTVEIRNPRSPKGVLYDPRQAFECLSIRERCRLLEEAIFPMVKYLVRYQNNSLILRENLVSVS